MGGPDGTARDLRSDGYDQRPVEYPTESFTEAERERLAPHFTNLDRPVFALVNLPETVKGALFARYSRYQGTLRRLFLDEFAADVPEAREAWDGVEGERAAKLYERIFLGYGDDSVAQLGGAHIACEWVSNVLTKVLQRPRLGAYLEQSTRYIAYDAPMPDPPGGYRYYRDPELGPRYAQAMDELFSIYSQALPRVAAWADDEFPRADRSRRGARARDQGQGARSAARAAAGQLAVAHGDLRDRPDLRAADPAPARAPAARGARLRADDPRRGQGRDAELRLAGRASRPRRRMGRLPRVACSRRRALGAAPRAARARRRRRSRPVGRAAAGGRRRGRAAGGAAVRVEHCIGGRDPRRGRGAALRRARASCWATSSASAPTAATGPGAGSRRCATGSRSSPTTARSATCSATGC